MNEDRELEVWRECWNTAAGPSPEFHRKIQQRIKVQNLRFVLGNVLLAITFLGILIFALFVRQQSSWLGTGWSTGIFALVLVSVVYRLWVMRGTWRLETQSTRGFLELWHKRVTARIRLLRISIYVSVGWILFCAALTAANWTTIGQDVRTHPTDWIEVLVASLLMQPVIWYWAAWLRRRKLAELNELNRILREIKE